MLRPEAMSKVIVAGSRDYMARAIDALYAHNLLHITDFVDETEDFKIGQPYPKAVKLSERAVSLRSIASYLNIKGKEDIAHKFHEATIKETIDEETERLNFEVTQVTKRLREVEARIKDINDKKRLLDPFKSFELPLEMYRGYRSLSVFVGTLKGIPSISDITNDYYLESAPYAKGTVIALFAPQEYKDDILSRLQDSNFSALPIPEEQGVPGDLLADLDRRLSELESEKEEAKAELEALRQKYIDYILATDEYLSVETQKAEAPLRFATTKNAFVIEGWIPTEELAKVQSDVNRASDGHVVVAVDSSEAINEEKVPVALDNAYLSRPLEVLVKAFSIPKYNELDPTAFMVFWYPFLFGLMLGDIGYGLIVVALAVLVTRKVKSKGMHDLAVIGLYGGIASVIFGFIFNEFFGVELFGHRGLVEFFYVYPTIPRLDNVLTLLIATFVIGLLMLSLGYVLGFINEYRQRGLKHAALAKLSWLCMLWGGVVVIIFILPPLTSGSGIQLSAGLIGGLVVAVVGFVMLIMGEGVVGIAELPSLLSNVLSYSRLLSIGISSTGIALAVNKLSDALFFSKGGVFVILGVGLLIAGHAVNTALGILDSGLQALRLHYVEFFTKFYDGGGVKYRPFGFMRKYTEEE